MFLLLLLLEHRACDDHRMLLHTHRRQRHYDLCLQPAHHRQPLGARRTTLPSPFPSAESGHFSFLLKTIICQDWVGTAKTQRDRSTLVFVPCRSLRGWEALPSLPGAGRTKSRTVCVLSSPVQSSPVQSRACLVKFSWSVHRKLRARRRPMSPNDH